MRITLEVERIAILREELSTLVLELHAWWSAGRLRARVSWGLLALIAISLASMPITQRLWAWDGFLQGGQDFETGAFLILISLCLVLVLAGSCKAGLARMLSVMRLMALLEGSSCGIPLQAVPSGAALLSGSLGNGYRLPLQI